MLRYNSLIVLRFNNETYNSLVLGTGPHVMDVDANFDIDAAIDASAANDPSIAGTLNDSLTFIAVSVRQSGYNRLKCVFFISGVVASADAFDVDSALDFDLDHITGSHSSDLTPSGSDLVDQSLPDTLLSPGDGIVSMDTGLLSD